MLAWWAVAVLTLAGRLRSLENGEARSPPLGWMSWGYYACGVDCDTRPDRCLNEALIMSVADGFYTSGYSEAGYQYIIIDDCWSEKQRDAAGDLVADRRRFPRGIKFLADYIHERGLKLGLYTNVAEVTCMHYPGSRHHLRQDARRFAAWGVDYLKVDGCYADEDWLNRAYIELGRYLNETDRPIVYSCSWPYYIEVAHGTPADYARVAAHCNLWRSYHDVALSWASVRDIARHYGREHARFARVAGPGRWNDPDMIIVGTGVLSVGQSRLQLAVWTMLSAPLLLSCDLSKISSWEKQLLQNLELIAVDQDPLGLQATPHQIADSHVTLWVKRHHPMKANKYHSFSFAFVNLESQESEPVEVSPRDYGLDNEDGYTVRDIFRGEFVRNVSLDDSLQLTVPLEDVVFYTLLTQR